MDKVEFVWKDATTGSVTIGHYTGATKDQLTRVSYVATLTQGRRGLLTAVHDPHDVRAALPAWVAKMEKDKATKGVATTLRCCYVPVCILPALDAECIVGCSPPHEKQPTPISLLSFTIAFRKCESTL